MTTPERTGWIVLPNNVMYGVDWYGWLLDNKVSGSYSLNRNYIIFDFSEDELAFRLRFGL